MRDTSNAYYRELWDTLEFLPDKLKTLEKQAKKLYENKDLYKRIGGHVGCPWIVVGLIHMMEASFNMKNNLHNGERWDKKTTLVPKGRGPFESWEEAAVDALVAKRGIFPDEWNVPDIARFLEKYNGLGYAKYHDTHSPYLWSFSNHGVGIGKYVADGSYDGNAVSSQVGAMVVYKYLSNNLEHMNAKKEDILVRYDPRNYNLNAENFQKFVNLVGGCGLITDGKAGPKTSDACMKVLGFYLIGDPRNIS